MQCNIPTSATPMVVSIPALEVIKSMLADLDAPIYAIVAEAICNIEVKTCAQLSATVPYGYGTIDHYVLLKALDHALDLRIESAKVDIINDVANVKAGLSVINRICNKYATYTDALFDACDVVFI